MSFIKTFDGYAREEAIGQVIQTQDGQAWHLYSVTGDPLGMASLHDFDPRRTGTDNQSRKHE